MSHPTERCELTNLCMITDAEGRILVQDRTDPSWRSEEHTSELQSRI